jgi:AcrR family transcriptional regulator
MMPKEHVVAYNRLDPKVRKEQLIKHALKLAERHGYDKFDSGKLAEAADVTRALVFRYFSTMAQLRRDIMRAAIRADPPRLKVIAQGLAARDPHARKAPEEIKKLAIATL